MANSHNEQGQFTKVTGAAPQEAHAPACRTEFYEIRVKGHLSQDWSDWLEGLELKLLEDGEMILSGNIVDQAALMGVLNKLNRLNLTLLSVNNVNRNNNMEIK